MQIIYICDLHGEPTDIEAYNIEAFTRAGNKIIEDGHLVFFGLLDKNNIDSDIFTEIGLKFRDLDLDSTVDNQVIIIDSFENLVPYKLKSPVADTLTFNDEKVCAEDIESDMLIRFKKEQIKTISSLEELE